jgi:hypothetical protein
MPGAPSFAKQRVGEHLLEHQNLPGHAVLLRAKRFHRINQRPQSRRQIGRQQANHLQSIVSAIGF